MIDVDGQRTRWGWWTPELIWEDADETGLRALHLLSHLRVAVHMTGDPAHRKKFRAAYDDLIARHRYHLLTRNQKVMVPGHINHSDDELAFLSFYPLLRYETEAPLLAIYKESLERSWQIERPERNPLWNVIYAAGTGAKEFDQDESLRTLREIPMDLVQWTVTNSHRQDVPVDPARRPLQAPPGADRSCPTTSCRCRSGTAIPTISTAATAAAAKTMARTSCCRTGWGGITACLKSEAGGSAVRVRGFAVRGLAGSIRGNQKL